jgi:F-type H+-transporting ATPase subunit delta
MSRAAIRYAKAVLDLANDGGNVKVVLNDMKSIKTTIDSSKELRDVLNSPIINAEHKRNVLKTIFVDISGETKGLLNVLADNGRSNLLGSVATSFISEYNKIHKIEEATVTTAVGITDELETKVLAKVRELTGSTDVKLKNTIDESIIGGFVLRVGDMQYNASIASQLGKLKREFNNSL